MVGIRNRRQLFVLFVFGFDHGGVLIIFGTQRWGEIFGGEGCGCCTLLGDIVVVMVIAGRLIVDGLEQVEIGGSRVDRCREREHLQLQLCALLRPGNSHCSSHHHPGKSLCDSRDLDFHPPFPPPPPLAPPLTPNRQNDSITV